MIKEIHINTLEELMPLLSEQEDRPDLGRNRSPYVYRGMTNADFRMVTSLRRNCKQLQRTLEPAILKNFAKYAVIEDPGVAQSVWHQMILGQHHGLPTRLLDWTQSALVALHFAVSEENLEHMADHDCMVWRMDIRELHALLEENRHVFLRGMAGIGKSELAKAYAKQYKKDYTNILYIPCTGDLKQDILDLDFADDLPASSQEERFRKHNRFLRGMFAWVGFRQEPILYDRDRRFAGESHYPLKKMLKLAADGVFSFSKQPLKAVTRLGAALLLIAGLTLLVLLILLCCGVGGGLWWLAMLMTGLTGCAVLSLGIVGEYIARIYDEVKGRPLYITAEALGFGDQEPEGRRPRC